MITNFEQYTHELTLEELNLCNRIVKGISRCIGKDNAITNKEIRNRLGNVTSGPRVRKMINFIRVNYLVPKLCATSNGYYVAATEEEHKEYIGSFEQRLNSMVAVHTALKADFERAWKQPQQQLSL